MYLHELKQKQMVGEPYGLGCHLSSFFVIIKLNEYGGFGVKHTRSIIVILIMHIVFGIIYNVLLKEILDALPAYDLTNEFFVIRGFLIDTPNNILVIPQFINWLLIVSFVFFVVMLFIRREINKNVSYRKASRL